MRGGGLLELGIESLGLGFRDLGGEVLLHDQPGLRQEELLDVERLQALAVAGRNLLLVGIDSAEFLSGGFDQFFHFVIQGGIGPAECFTPDFLTGCPFRV